MPSNTNRVDTARRVLSLVDLTDLGDDSTADDVRALCARAVAPPGGARGSVAAVCVWPRFVAVAKAALGTTPVRVATVTNFPSGAEPTARVLAQTEAALADGADEIDVVLPYRTFAGGDTVAAAELLGAVRSAVPRDGSHLLKVILETGELQQLTLVRAAALLAIDCGADFIKTSTGKTPISASLEATEVMLSVIRETNSNVGLKPSGGIRTLDDAAAYLAQAGAMMGADWVSPRTFRFGASGLLSALLDEIDTTSPRETTGTDY